MPGHARGRNIIADKGLEENGTSWRERSGDEEYIRRKKHEIASLIKRLELESRSLSITQELCYILRTVLVRACW